ncbi:ABC transporter permease [Rufibacter quisquiliarum]|uniref:Putative ABC transport system permease protein n=1 Tax=Rufibacter quisquiliarum TaxID=1549639 RepID=A0A839GUU5_9BACT|nr:ABC transporter permease [Rufibacter quisquiliarum]MBA9079255.1 putative ABC transport system permease protein [Rufibacter quisquiliarum]
MIYLRLVFESFRFAWQALRSNLLRTILSLLGVTIGIFAIISVFTIVDSLEKSIRQSMSFVGERIVYIQKWPWIFEGGNDIPWWKYMQRPSATVREYNFLNQNLENDEGVALVARRGSNTFKHGSNSMSGIMLQGVTQDFNKVAEVPIEEGRYFTQQETDGSRNVIIIGAEVAQNLFPNGSALGGDIRIQGQKFTVIGIMEKQGAGLFEGMPTNDKNAYTTFGAFGKMFASGQRGIEPNIMIKGRADDEGLQNLEYEVRGKMRTIRGLKPYEEDNFAVNRSEMMADAIGKMFSIIGLAGWVIGGFSILVGGFGIANIMFVSVKERTNIIGIQKSLGAKNFFILFQFLFESVFLSLIGGGVGILLVSLITLIPMGTLEIFLSAGNILLGLGVSVVIGVLSGIIPAVIASHLDPVIAIRSK